MGTRAGIQITPKFARIVVLQNGGKVSQFKEVPIEEIKSLTTGIHVPRTVAASVDSNFAVLREMSLPFVSDEQIEKTYRFQFESLLHGHNIDELIVSYIKAGQTSSESYIICIGAPRNEVAKCLKACEAVNIDPVLVDLDVFALLTALNKLGRIKNPGKSLIAYRDSDETKLMFIENGRPTLIRCTTVALEALKSEIQRFLAASSTESPDQMILIGDVGNKMELERYFGIPLVNVDGSKGIVAYGLALRAIGSDDLGLDLRKDEFSYKKKYQKIKAAATLTIELLIVLFALVSLNLHFNGISKARADLNDIYMEQRKICNECEIPTAKVKDEDLFNTFKRHLDKQRGLSGDTDIPIKSALDEWQKIFALFNELFTENQSDTGFYIEIDHVAIDTEQKTLRIEGKTLQKYLQSIQAKLASELSPSDIPGTNFIKFRVNRSLK